MKLVDIVVEGEARGKCARDWR